MNEPIIFCIDDDQQVLRAITRDLKSHYRPGYKILSTSSVKEALDALLELKNKGEAIALFISCSDDGPVIRLNSIQRSAKRIMRPVVKMYMSVLRMIGHGSCGTRVTRHGIVVLMVNRLVYQLRRT